MAIPEPGCCDGPNELLRKILLGLPEITVTSAVGSVTGTGTANYVPKWNTSTELVNSIIYANATSIGVNVVPTDANIIGHFFRNNNSLSRILVENINPGSSTAAAVQLKNSTFSSFIAMGGTSYGVPNGLYLQNFTTGGAPILFWRESGQMAGIYPSGVSLGVGVPTARLHISAGAAAAGNGQIKLNAGTLLTTTEAGVIENDGTNLYYTAANGGIRYQLNRLKGFTVATLPAGVQGDTNFVTDALAPAFMATVVGGGAVVTKVFYNGTNWIVQ